MSWLKFLFSILVFLTSSGGDGSLCNTLTGSFLTHPTNLPFEHRIETAKLSEKKKHNKIHTLFTDQNKRAALNNTSAETAFIVRNTVYFPLGVYNQNVTKTDKYVTL